MSSAMEKDEIFAMIKEVLVDTFELNPDSISERSRLNEDLDLDSIDAADLIVKLQQEISIKIDAEVFKQVRTLGDVVDALLPLVGEKTV
jgi:acyl carrier protein